MAGASEAVGNVRRAGFWRRRSTTALARLVSLLVLASLITLAASVAPLRLTDLYLFDRVERVMPATPPRVVIVDLDSAPGQEAQTLAAIAERAHFARICIRGPLAAPLAMHGHSAIAATPVTPVPGRMAWRFQDTDAKGASSVVPALDYGILRSQRYGLPSETETPLPVFESACAGRAPVDGQYLVPMPAAQNIPRIPASALAAASFDSATTRSLTAIVAPYGNTSDREFTLSLNSAAPSPASEFSARAVQALLDGTEVRIAPRWLQAALVLAAVIAGTLLAAASRNKRLALPLTLTGCVVTLLGAAAALWFGHLLVPVSAMLLAVIIAGLVEIFRRERAQDRYLGRTLEEAINLSFDRALFHDSAALPGHLVAIAQALRLPETAIVGREPTGGWQVLAKGPRELPGLDLGSAAQRALFERTLTLMRAQLSAEGDIWLVPLSGGETPMLWLYTLPKSRDGEQRGETVRQIARNLRQARGWQHTLLGNEDAAGSAPVDVRVASAANLITIQSEQIRRGLDALDTAVLVFHPAGFALEANARMAELCLQFAIQPERIGVTDAILALTEITRPQAEVIVRRMLLRGGEMRVPMRAVAGRSHVLRIGASESDADIARRVIVLEAVDTSELDQLAQLRLAVGVFIDRQLRNDLEAITLGATLALDARVGPERIARLAERIKDVAARATGRLEDVSELLEEQRLGTPGPCYPIEVRKCLVPMLEEVEAFAAQSGVVIESHLPGISGFTLAEPTTLAEMTEAVLRLVIADTARGGVVTFTVEEVDKKTRLRIAGGFGMPFDRLVEALDARAGEVPPEFQTASAGFARVLAWQGSVAYWSAAGDGYKFTIQLRRIG